MSRVLNLRRDDCSRAVRIDRASQWGNPFKIGKNGTRDQVCDLYAKWFEEQPHLVKALHELRGHDLACWCAPQRCHGEYLLNRANEALMPTKTSEPITTDSGGNWAIAHRPQDTNDLIAPESLLDAIDERIELRDENAFLIGGPTGCGKTTIAKMLAHGYTRTRWGTSTSDIIEINAGADSTIEHTRKLVETSRFLPSKKGSRRVIWIEEAHSYLEKAATPLLRAIEESPKTTVWIFATNRPEKMLRTLVDRCYSIKVDLAPVDDLRKLLLRVLKREGRLQDWTKEDRAKLCNAIVRASGQIPRSALNILKAAADQSAKYDTVDDLLAAPVLNAPQASLDNAALKIILALLATYSTGKSTTKKVFAATLGHDGYGLLSRLVWVVSNVFLEQATGQQQPGSYYFNQAAMQVDAVKNMESATALRAMSIIYARMTEALTSMKDFQIDPGHVLRVGLINLHEELRAGEK